jgi:G3E family GTPase
MSALVADSRIPVTVITGFLGSGKTTLLNHILTTEHGMKIAVIENEFGAVGVDDALLKSNKRFESEEEVIEMLNGCICCTVRSDLITVLKRMFITKKLKVDAVIIETTGLADPAPVAQTFFVDEEVSKICRLDAIITVVDAKHIMQHLTEVKPDGVENESVEQVAFADRILLNKCDLATPEELVEIKRNLLAINSTAKIFETTKSVINPRELLNIEGFSLDAILTKEPDFLDTSGEHQHDLSVTSVAWVHPDPMNIGKLQAWIDNMMKEKGKFYTCCSFSFVSIE